MEYVRENSEAVLLPQSPGSLRTPSRPPHPNPSLTPEALAPLIVEQANEAIKEMEKSLVSSAVEPISVATVVQGIHSSRFETDPNEQEDKRMAQLKLIWQVETAGAEIACAREASCNEILKLWGKTIYPLIEQMLDLSKAGESRVADAMKRLRGQYSNLKESIAELIDASSDGVEDLAEKPPVPDIMMDQLTSVATDSTRQQRRQERSVLSALLYDPYSQFEECRLNELAISMKQRGFEIDMDPRDPVVGVGDDDARLVSIYVGNKIRQLARTVSERLVADLLDPISSLTITDRQMLQDHCAAIGNTRKITFKVNGVNSLDFTLTLPAMVPFSMKDVSREIEELIAPMTSFEKALGFNHTIDWEQASGSIKLTFKLFLPAAESRFEPQSFHLKERALERLADVDIAERLQSLKESVEQERGVSFSAQGVDISEPALENIALRTMGDVSIIIYGSLFEEFSPDETLDILRTANQIAQRQPTIRYVSISLRSSEEDSFLKSHSTKPRVIFQFDGDSTDAISPLAITREVIEKQRAAFVRLHPLEQLMTMRNMREYGVFLGVLPIEEMATVGKRIEQLPSWVDCIGVRLKLLTLKEEPFNALIKTLEDIKENYQTNRIFLTERPTSPFAQNVSKSMRFIVYSDTEIPLAQVDLNTASAEVTISRFDTVLLEELRDRALIALTNPEAYSLRRIREIDLLLGAAGLDLSPPLLQELTMLSNSWAGRKLPASRIADVLDKYIFDVTYTIDRRGDTIRCLHRSENFTSNDTPTDLSGQI